MGFTYRGRAKAIHNEREARLWQALSALLHWPRSTAWYQAQQHLTTLYQMEKPVVQHIHLVRLHVIQSHPLQFMVFWHVPSGDQVIGALCALMRDANYTLLTNECVPYANERWNEEDALNCTLSKKGMPTSQYYKLTNPNRTSCPVVTVAHNSMSMSRTPKDSQLYFERGGVIIVNHGVHCKEPGCVTSKLESWFKDLSFMSEKGWRVMYRETERQHFASANGYYAINMTKQKCHSLEEIGGDYRNKEARTFLHKLALVENTTIPIIPLASATEPLYFMHGFDSERGNFDCTHYVYSPWRLELTWDGILRGLKGLYDESI